MSKANNTGNLRRFANRPAGGHHRQSGHGGTARPLSTSLTSKPTRAALIAAIAGDPAPRIVHADEAFAALTGYDPDEIVGMSCDPGTTPSPPSGLSAILGALARQDEASAFTLPRKDGTEFPCYISTHWIGYGEHEESPPLLVATLFDASVWTEFRRENELAALLLNQMGSIAGIGQWSIDHETGEVDWSDTVYEIFEVKRGDFEPTLDSVFGFYPPEDRENIRTTFRQHLEERAPYLIDQRLIMPDGRTKFVQTSAETIHADDGRPLKTHGVVIDLTEVRRAQQDLLDSNERFQLAQQATDAMIADWQAPSDTFTWYMPPDMTFDPEMPSAGAVVRESFESLLERVHPGDRDRIRRQVSSHVEDPNVGRYILEYRMRIHGNYAHMYECGIILRDAEGAKRRVVAAIRDITDIKLMSSELESLLSCIDQGVAYHAADGTILRINNYGRSVVGLTGEEMLGRKPGALPIRMLRADGSDLPPEEHPALLCARSGKNITNYIIGVVKPGESEPSWLLAHWRPWRGPETPDAPAVIATFADVSELFKAKEKLAFRTRLQELMMETSALFIDLPPSQVKKAVRGILSRLGSCLGVDRALACLFERGTRKLEFCEIWRAPGTEHPEGNTSHDQLQKIIDAATDEALAGEMIIRSADDLPPDSPLRSLLKRRGVCSTVSVPLIEKGRAVGFVAVAHTPGKPANHPVEEEREFLFFFARILLNIRRRLHNLDELRESRRFLADLIENSGSPIFSMDLKGNMTLVNRAWESAIGIPRTEAVGAHSRATLEKAGLHHFKDNESFAIKSGRAQEFVEAIPDRENPGQLRTFITTRFPNRDKDGKVVGITGIATEITARLRAEEEARAREAAETVARSRLEFLARISHEIRTPIQAVLGFGSLLKDNTSLDAKARKHLKVVSESARRLVQLVDDLLQFGRIEAGSFQVVESDIDLAAFLEDFVAPQARHAREKDIEFSLQLPPSIPDVIRGDPIKIRQILANLVGNSLKFVKEGSITLNVRLRDRETGGRDESRSSQQMLVFEISDTGPGIADEDIPHLFDDFYQGRSGRAAGIGSGLGLPVCRQLARAMNGEIFLTGNSEQGCTFSLFLPLALPGANAPEPIAAQSLTDSDASHPVNPSPAPRSEMAVSSLPASTRRKLGAALHLGDAAAMRRLLPSQTEAADTNAFAALLRLVDQYEYETLARLLPRPQGATALSDPDLATPPDTCDILVIDDSPVNLSLIEEILSGSGHRVRCLPCPQAAIQAANSMPPNLFVVDAIMPQFDGFTLRAQIRNSPKMRSTPMLFTSATKDENLVSRIYADRNTAFIAKPFLSEELLACTSLLLRLAAAERGS